MRGVIEKCHARRQKSRRISMLQFNCARITIDSRKGVLKKTSNMVKHEFIASDRVCMRIKAIRKMLHALRFRQKKKYKKRWRREVHIESTSFFALVIIGWRQKMSRFIVQCHCLIGILQTQLSLFSLFLT
jgi:hypothetical protein